jgi:RPA family protein
MATIQAKPDRQMLLQWLQHTQTQWIWERIAELKEREKDESLEAKYFTKMTSEEYRDRIDNSLKEYRSGNYTTLEDFEKETKSW